MIAENKEKYISFNVNVFDKTVLDKKSRLQDG